MRIKRIVIIALAVLFILLIADIVISNFMLKTTQYTLSCDKLNAQINVAELCDLHGVSFGKENSRLVEKVKNAEPDLIFLTGDMIDSKEHNTSDLYNLILKLNDIAPVYFSSGNHEQYNVEEVKKTVLDAGAKYLDCEYEDICVNGQNLRIGGVYGYCTSDAVDKYFASLPDNAFMKEFQQTDRTKLLLCHIPASWIHKSTLDYWDVDFIYSGHTHGGQIVLPIVGPLYASDMGFFPGKVSGVFNSEVKSNVLIISSGLGTHKLPRINNIPEVVVTKLVPKTQ